MGLSLRRYLGYLNFMPEMSSVPLPVIRALRQLGHDLALARRRRGISTADMAGRLFISRRTLWRLEKGDPTSLPLRAGPHHSPTLFGVIQDCGPDRWGRVLIERAVRRHVLDAKPYRDLD